MIKQLSFLSANAKPCQLGFVVQDIDETVKQYHSRFGIGGWQFYTYGPPLLTYMTRNGHPCSYKVRIALNNFFETRIELIQQIEGDTVYQEFIDKHGYGIHHLGIYINDIPAAIAEAEAAGIRVTMEGAGFGLDGDGYFAYLDTEVLLGTT
jgi:hypothetical protein